MGSMAVVGAAMGKIHAATAKLEASRFSSREPPSAAPTPDAPARISRVLRLKRASVAHIPSASRSQYSDDTAGRPRQTGSGRVIFLRQSCFFFAFHKGRTHQIPPRSGDLRISGASSRISAPVREYRNTDSPETAGEQTTHWVSLIGFGRRGRVPAPPSVNTSPSQILVNDVD